MIVTTWSASHVRLILRVYFILIVALIAWLAEMVLQSRAKLQVINTRKVPVNRVLGWIQGFDLVTAFFSLRQSPGGKVGYLAMVIVFILSKGADLMTTTFVQQVPIQSRCAFGDGLVFNEAGPAFFTFPPVNGAPYIGMWRNSTLVLSLTSPFTKQSLTIPSCSQLAVFQYQQFLSVRYLQQGQSRYQLLPSGPRHSWYMDMHQQHSSYV